MKVYREQRQLVIQLTDYEERIFKFCLDTFIGEYESDDFFKNEVSFLKNLLEKSRV